MNKGSSNKVPVEYWEYRLVEEHFRGNWDMYWNMPEPWIDLIVGFRTAEGEAEKRQIKRLAQEKQHGRPTN